MSPRATIAVSFHERRLLGGSKLVLPNPWCNIVANEVEGTVLAKYMAKEPPEGGDDDVKAAHGREVD